MDGKISRLIHGTSTSTRTSEITGSLATHQPASSVDGEPLSTTPTTNNPPPEELRYVPGAEDREISQRLSRSQTDASAADALRLSDALRRSQLSGREFLSAEEEYILAAIRVLSERHLWGPRFFNDTRATLDGTGDEGSFQHALSIVNTLRATKRLPYGGEVEARWVYDATEQLRRQSTGRYSQSSELVLSGNLPLLKGAGDVAREDLIQAERSLIYQARTFERFRREYLVSIAGDFFQLVQQRARIANQESQLESLINLENATNARVEAGRLDEFQKGVARSRVLAGQASLAGLRESFTLQLDRFKVRLGLAPDMRLDVSEIDLTIPDPAVSLEEAGRLALELRLDLQNQRDQVGDARRAVANRRNALLPNFDLTGSVSLPTDNDEQVGGLKLDPDELGYSAGFLLSLPLDRETERLDLRAANIRLAQRERDYEQSRDDIVVRVRSALRRVDLARFQLGLAEQQVEINERRLVGQNLKKDQLDPQVIVDSQQELLEAKNNRDQAQTDLRNAILNYLLESDQLRVARDGTFEPLPGMDSPPAPVSQ